MRFTELCYDNNTLIVIIIKYSIAYSTHKSIFR